MLDLEPQQYVSWCQQVIHHAALVAKRKYERWEREPLLLNSFSDDDGSEIIDAIPCPKSGQAFTNKELEISLHSLSKQQFQVIYDTYFNGYSQNHVARHLHISDRQVRRLKQQAFEILRKKMLL